MDIFKKIRNLRIEKKLSQKDIAQNLGISQAAYAKIEKPSNPDEKKISIEYGILIAKSLGVSFNELFEIENPKDSNHEALKLKVSQLEIRISELEEQLRDKKTIIDFIEKNDIEFLRSIAAILRHQEVNENPDNPNSGEWGFDFNDRQEMMNYVLKKLKE